MLDVKRFSGQVGRFLIGFAVLCMAMTLLLAVFFSIYWLGVNLGLETVGRVIGFIFLAVTIAAIACQLAMACFEVGEAIVNAVQRRRAKNG